MCKCAFSPDFYCDVKWCRCTELAPFFMRSFIYINQCKSTCNHYTLWAFITFVSGFFFSIRLVIMSICRRKWPWLNDFYTNRKKRLYQYNYDELITNQNVVFASLFDIDFTLADSCTSFQFNPSDKIIISLRIYTRFFVRHLRRRVTSSDVLFLLLTDFIEQMCITPRDSPFTVD